MIITAIKGSPLDPATLRLCMLIRFGKFRAAPAARAVAKSYTFGFFYGVTANQVRAR